MEIVAEACSTRNIAFSVGISIEAASAHLFRLYHLGIVWPIAIEEHDDEPRLLYVWEMTEHGRHHKQLEPRCFGCRMRERYLAANEALIE